MRRTSCLLARRADFFKSHENFKFAETITSGYTTWPSDSLKEIAILGGGITGLASAYFATHLYPNARITLFESSNRFGGWIKSSTHTVPSGTVVFEHGPRSLRPAYGTLGLIFSLGLKDQLLLTPKTSPAARNRFVYLENRLVNVQRGILGMIQEPVLRRALFEGLRTCFHPSRGSTDETVGQFLRRRGLTSTANDLISAMIHGIYAGDIDELSADSIFPNLIRNENIYGSPWNYFKKQLSDRLSGSYLPPLKLGASDNMKGALRSLWKLETEESEFLAASSASVYTLRGGLETLITALVDHLKAHPRVKLITGAMAQSIQPAKKNSNKNAQDTNEKVRLVVRYKERETAKGLQAAFIDSEYDGIISAIPSASLGELCPPIKDVMNKTPAATVCVVNLFYDQTDLLPVRGFGYLIPKSTPKSMNPERILGVVFDSDATPDLDTASGTKLTVMLGGHYWKNLSKELFPSTSDAIEMAKGALAAQLGITQDPILAQANLHIDCIPQYITGHGRRMSQASRIMLGNGHWSRVRVAGSWYDGVAINSCIEAAFETTMELARGINFGSLPKFYRDVPKEYIDSLK